MATRSSDEGAGFLSILGASQRSPQIPEADDAYGWLVGSWDLEVDRYAGVDVADQGLRAEAHFAWVLDGLAIQDLWIMPPRAERGAQLGRQMNMYGTTLRVFDASLRAWRITWSNPAGGHFEEQVGRRVGAEIVQIGTRFDGTPTRWRFTEIAADSFRWLGEALQTNGTTWKPEGEFRAKRTA